MGNSRATTGYRASRTAVLVCQGRAVAHERIAAGRFTDPTAMTLLRADEQAPVRHVRDGEPPKGWGLRMEYEMVRGCAEVIIPRTVAIDDAVRAHPTPQLVILGAGLDGRAWRMPELATATVFEVDQPASQQDKRDRASALPGAPPRFVPVDFTRDSLAGALAAAGHRAEAATTWIWEGVIPYLTPADVSATLAAVASLSAEGSRLIVNFQTPSLTAALGRVLARAMSVTSGKASPWAGEPRRSAFTPQALAALVSTHGFAVTTDTDLLTVAEALPMTVAQRTSMREGRIMVADR
jgi:methyltransferase (TIGR00027 family)